MSFIIICNIARYSLYNRLTIIVIDLRLSRVLFVE